MKLFEFLIEVESMIDKVYIASEDLHTALNLVEKLHGADSLKAVMIYDEAFYIALTDEDE